MIYFSTVKNLIKYDLHFVSYQSYGVFVIYGNNFGKAFLGEFA